MWRYLVAAIFALALVFTLLWVGSWIATIVLQPDRQQNDFTVGRRMDLCGYAVDMRHAAGGYDLDEWSGERCRSLSALDRCILSCLSEAGTVEIGAACYSDCLSD
jgi:hypothetical protein